jgi:hypothetical protein
LLELSNRSLLSFALVLTDGTIIETVGEAADYFGKLDDPRREQHFWRVAIMMLNNALKEPTYLKAATISLQTALLLEKVLVSPHPLDQLSR